MGFKAFKSQLRIEALETGIRHHDCELDFLTFFINIELNITYI